MYIVVEHVEGTVFEQKYYEPFTNTEFVSIRKKEHWYDYIAPKDIDPRVWAIRPFEEIGGDDGSRRIDGDFEGHLATFNSDDPQYCHFRSLKDNVEYKNKLREFFDSLRTQAKLLQPEEPTPEEILKDFLNSLK